jgi:hypothetical protein
MAQNDRVGDSDGTSLNFWTIVRGTAGLGLRGVFQVPRLRLYRQRHQDQRRSHRFGGRITEHVLMSLTGCVPIGASHNSPKITFPAARMRRVTRRCFMRRQRAVRCRSAPLAKHDGKGWLIVRGPRSPPRGNAHTRQFAARQRGSRRSGRPQYQNNISQDSAGTIRRTLFKITDGEGKAVAGHLAFDRDDGRGAQQPMFKPYGPDTDGVGWWRHGSTSPFTGTPSRHSRRPPKQPNSV